MQPVERRRFTRWEIGRQAKIKLAGAEFCVNCNINNLNLKGAQIALAMKLPKDTFLRFELHLSEDLILNVEAWVAWQKSIEGHNVYGVYFTKIHDSDKERIYQFLRRDFGRQIDQRWWQDTKERGQAMAGAGFEDRRVFERFPTGLAVRYVNTSANREGAAQTQNISAKGVGLVTKEALPVRDSLELWLEIPDTGEPLYTRGEVVWTKPVAMNEYQVGINLEKADLMGLSRVLRMRQ